jgi:hypothetical protein
MPELHLLPAQPGVFFSESDHKYFYRSTRTIEVPSSSHIISLAGGKDFDKTHWRKSLMRKGLSEFGSEYFMERVRVIRASVGTETHALIAHGLGYHDERTKRWMSMEAYDIYEQWQNHVLPRIGKVYVIEQPMIHPGGCYGFTPDLVAEVDGILSLCDWKSNQAEYFAERYERLVAYELDDQRMRGICEHLAECDAESGRVREATARVRDGWQMQQGSYAFGLDAVTGLRVERGINFMLSVDGVKEHTWNRRDLDQGWIQFAGGLALHHYRAASSGADPVFLSALHALAPLMR